MKHQQLFGEYSAMTSVTSCLLCAHDCWGAVHSSAPTVLAKGARPSILTRWVVTLLGEQTQEKWLTVMCLG